MLTLNLRGSGGSGVKRNLTIVFYDPENLDGHNRLSLSITAEFRTWFLRNAKNNKNVFFLKTLLFLIKRINIKNLTSNYVWEINGLFNHLTLKPYHTTRWFI